jgi:L-fuconate dehydratase
MSETLIGRNVEELLDNMRLAWDLFVRDSQLRWLGPVGPQGQARR